METSKRRILDQRLIVDHLDILRVVNVTTHEKELPVFWKEQRRVDQKMKSDCLDQSFKQSAEYYQSVARRAAEIGNTLGARAAYLQSIQWWKKAAGSHPCFFHNQIVALKEYGRLVKADKTYLNTLAEIKDYIAGHPGVGEINLSLARPKIHKTQLSFVLHSGIKDGEIVMREGGRLFLAERREIYKVRSFLAKLYQSIRAI